MAVPLVNLHAQYNQIRTEVREAIDRVCDNQSFILGSEVEAFEKEFATYCNAKHAIGVSSGSDALLASLMALDIGPGDEVITTPFTFFATAGAIHRLGAKPVFADIDPHTFNLDATTVNQQITDATKAVIVVHLFGQCADMDALLSVCGDIPIIEDSAQSVGAEAWVNKKAVRTGAIGKMATFSFFPAKNLGCFGDGGAITTDDDELAARLRRLRNHGQSRRYHHEEVGGNFRLDAIQAAILRVKLRHLDSWVEGRQSNAHYYQQRFQEAGILAPNGCVTIPTNTQPRHVWNQYVIRISNGQRDSIAARLKEREIGHAVYYPSALHKQPCFAHLNQQNLDQAEAACTEVLALPIVPELTEEEQHQVAETFIQASGC